MAVPLSIIYGNENKSNTAFWQRSPRFCLSSSACSTKHVLWRLVTGLYLTNTPKRPGSVGLTGHRGKLHGLAYDTADGNLRNIAISASETRLHTSWHSSKRDWVISSQAVTLNPNPAPHTKTAASTVAASVCRWFTTDADLYQTCTGLFSDNRPFSMKSRFNTNRRREIIQSTKICAERSNYTVEQCGQGLGYF